MTIRHRIYIGEAPTEEVAELSGYYFDGATVYSGLGVWQRQTEPTTIVEVVGATQAAVAAFSRRACERWNQSAVLFTEETVTARLVDHNGIFKGKVAIVGP